MTPHTPTLSLLSLILVLTYSVSLVFSDAGQARAQGAPQRPATLMNDPAPLKNDPDFLVWRDGFRQRALAQGIRADVLDVAFSGLSPDYEVIKKDRNQSEFNRTIWDYLDSAVSEKRIFEGREILRRYHTLLSEIEAIYGVNKEVVVAIWGMESNYGSNRGSHSIIRSLATLAYDGRRGAFFEEQLIAALKIIQNGDISIDRMRGSWAGAMGHTQFMPTSWWAYAVDHNGDGKREIWGNDPTDALASTARYLQRSKWKLNVPWGIEVILPAGFNYALAGGRSGKAALFSQWARYGVRLARQDKDAQQVERYGPASLFLPAGAEGPAFLIFSNFKSIARYNSADAYVMAVGRLADIFAGADPLVAKWPRHNRALTRAEKRELQQRLTAAGYNTQGVDGLFGPNSIAALRAWQKAMGVVPDGYADIAVLQALR